MNIKDLQAIIDTNDVTKIIQTFDNFCQKYDVSDAIRQYSVNTHKIFDETEFPNKIVNNDEGNMEAVINIARLPIPIQKTIVLVAAAFLGVPEIDAIADDAKQQDLLTMLNKILEDNKFDYKFMSFIKKVKGEKKAAFLFYTVPLEGGDDYWDGFPISSNFKLRMRVLSKSCGDTLYPFFDDFGDMIAFAREYKLKTSDTTGMEIEQRHFDLYTDAQIIYSTEINGKWDVKSFTNLIKKIPVVYASQPLTDWEDVQKLIERLEVKTSKHADSNDYHDQPIVLAKGDVKGFSKKGESGKVLEMGENADVSYLGYDSLPESMKMEIDNLKQYINKHTHTPDISFDQMKNIAVGTLSGYAIKLLFMDAHMKAYDSEEIFGEAAQRIYNYLKKAISIIAPEFKPSISLQMKPKFSYFLPQNDTETLQNIKSALEAGIISLKTAIKLNPLIQDYESEKVLIDAQKQAAPPPIPPLPKPNGLPVPANN